MGENLTNIKIYCMIKRSCDNCDTLKNLLQDEDIEYEIIDVETLNAVIELLCNGIYARSLPILQIGKRFYPNVLTREELRNILKSNAIYAKND